MTVLRADTYASNAELVEACYELGYLADDLLTLDPTYGKGTWWKNRRPECLVAHDLALDGVDFRKLVTGPGAPHMREEFDRVVYDPPYVSTGGRKTSTIPKFNQAYGLVDTPRTPHTLHHDLVVPGLYECFKATAVGGYCLVKSMNYVSGGHLFPGTYEIVKAAHWFKTVHLEDELIHLGDTGPQPTENLDGSPRQQRHSRANFSTLLVFRKFC